MPSEWFTVTPLHQKHHLLAACWPKGNVKGVSDTEGDRLEPYSCQMQFWGPGCQWPPLRSCRFPLRQFPSSPLPQCTGGQCKAPWSAHACQRHSRCKSVHFQTSNGGPFLYFGQNKPLYDLVRRQFTETHVLCHHVDFDAKHSTLFLRRRSLQAEVSSRELHRELHFDLMTITTAELNSTPLMSLNSTLFFIPHAEENEIIFLSGCKYS